MTCSGSIYVFFMPVFMGLYVPSYACVCCCCLCVVCVYVFVCICVCVCVCMYVCVITHKDNDAIISPVVILFSTSYLLLAIQCKYLTIEL